MMYDSVGKSRIAVKIGIVLLEPQVVKNYDTSGCYSTDYLSFQGTLQAFLNKALGFLNFWKGPLYPIFSVCISVR